MAIIELIHTTHSYIATLKSKKEDINGMQQHKLGVARDINSEVPRGRRQPLLLLHLLWQLLRLVLYHYLLLPREGRSHIIMVSVLVLDQEVDHQLVLVGVEVLERDGRSNNATGE